MTLGYDANGSVNHTVSNGTSYWLTYDEEARTTRWDLGGSAPGQGTSYSTNAYNGLGLRISRRDVSGNTHSLAYDGSSPGAALLTDSNNGGTLFTPGLMQQDSSGQHFWQLDALGSVRGTSNNSQSPTGEVYYDAFGLSSLSQGSPPSPFGFVGGAGYQTDDTGLMLLGNRYYAAGIGRFLSEDPSGDGGNWYDYCDNNPLTKTDPTGLASSDPAHYITQLSTVTGNVQAMSEGGFYQGDTLAQMTAALAEMNNNRDIDAALAASDDTFTFDPVVVDGAYGASTNLGGTTRGTVEVGFAMSFDYYDGAFHWNHEFFVSYSLQAGFGFGRSMGPSIGVGIGDLKSFNDYSFVGSFVGGPHSGLGYVYNDGYAGLDWSPSTIFNRGFEEGIYPTGMSYTKPISVFPKGLFGSPTTLRF